MMDLYVLGIGSVAIVLLFSYAKVMRNLAKQSALDAQAATESANTKETVIAQQHKTAEAVIQVRSQLQTKHKAEQVKVDAGERDAFSGDSF